MRERPGFYLAFMGTSKTFYGGFLYAYVFLFYAHNLEIFDGALLFVFCQVLLGGFYKDHEGNEGTYSACSHRSVVKKSSSDVPGRYCSMDTGVVLKLT